MSLDNAFVLIEGHPAFTTAFTAVGKLEIQGPVFTGCMIEAGTFPPQAAAGVD